MKRNDSTIFTFINPFNQISMKNKISILLLTTVLLLSGCATPKESIIPDLDFVDIPPLNEPQKAELGDTLVEKGKIYTHNAIRLENEITAGDGFLLKKFTLEPGILKARLKDHMRIYYMTDRLMVYDALLGTTANQGGLAIGLIDKNDITFHLNGVSLFSPSTTPIYTEIQVADTERPSFRQELIYNGKSGDILKFLYREYSNDYLRAPFTQDIQYDLKDGNIIGFKKMRIEILGATNTQINYIVLSTFPDSI